MDLSGDGCGSYGVASTENGARGCSPEKLLLGLPQTNRYRGAAFKTLNALLVGWLLLIEQRRAADSLLPEVEIHLDAVGDLDERNALVHPVVFTVENHFSFNFP
jgi:hypothetical protein